MYPLVSDLADEGIPVALTCRVLGFSRQGYFKWRAKPICDRDLSDAYLINDALDAHNDDPGFGYRFISDELEAAGHAASENRVHRLCSMQGIFSVHSKKRGAGRRPGPPVHDDLVQRDFSAEEINTLWLTDISEHPTKASSISAPSRMPVPSGSSATPWTPACRQPWPSTPSTTHLSAVRWPPPSCTATGGPSSAPAHSYAHSARPRCVGPWAESERADNAAMESFFALLQKNVLNTQRWKTREELRLAIATWIEKTYNRRRRQRGLGRLTPVEYETIYSVAKAA
jgi:putative transposase